MGYILRKGINFAKKIDKYYQQEKTFKFLRTLSTMFSLLSIFLLVMVIYFNLKTTIEIRDLSIKKNQLIGSVSQLTVENKKLFEIADKTNYVKRLLDKEDVQFWVYYGKINEIIENISKESTDSAVVLKNFDLDNKRQTKFELVTTTPANYLKVLQFIDREEFLNIFENLNLTSFSLKKNLEENVYSLEFTGVFKELDNELED